MSTPLVAIIAGALLGAGLLPVDRGPDRGPASDSLALARARQGPRDGYTSEQAAPVQGEAKPGVIRGRITSALTGKALRRARVTLLPASESSLPTFIGASTSAEGTFELKDVPPGAYFVAASRAGHLTVQYGQRRAGERGVAVEVRAGRTVQKIDIALTRGSVLAGHITDELGEPYPGVRVSALDLRYRLGRRVPIPVGSATTDDLGEYRIPGLQPGSYYVSAWSTETWQNEKKESLGYATTYYPGAPADLAQTVNLAASQDRLDLDFTLAMSRTARITGRVQRPTGEPAAGEPVSLALTIRGTGLTLAGTSTTVRTAADGTFELRNVPPSDYSLRAGSRDESATVFLEVNGDIRDVLLVPRSGSPISGIVVADDGAPPPFPASGVRMLLIAPEDDKVLPTVRVPAVNNNWSFRLLNVGGPFLFRVRGIPDDWMLDAVKLREQDITDVPYDVPAGGREIAGMQVVLTRKVGTIAGDVLSANGKPARDATVLIFSEEAELWMPGSRFVRTTRPDTAGHFSIAGLPSATYLAVAKDFIVDGQWEDKEFLESVRKDAATIVLGQGESAAVTLKLPPVR